MSLFDRRSLNRSELFAFYSANPPAPNDPARKGELAARKRLFGECNRYAVAPVHTRFDAIEWFVWDAEHPASRENFLAVVIRQEATLEAALHDLI